MTTLTQFTPTVSQNFSFQPTLDGQEYSAEITWSLFGQRWVLDLYSLNGTLIMSRPLTGSPPNYDINLVASYFTQSTLVYRAASNNLEVTP